MTHLTSSLLSDGNPGLNYGCTSRATTPVVRSDLKETLQWPYSLGLSEQKQWKMLNNQATMLGETSPLPKSQDLGTQTTTFPSPRSNLKCGKISTTGPNNYEAALKNGSHTQVYFYNKIGWISGQSQIHTLYTDLGHDNLKKRRYKLWSGERFGGQKVTNVSGRGGGGGVGETPPSEINSAHSHIFSTPSLKIKMHSTKRKIKRQSCSWKHCRAGEITQSHTNQLLLYSALNASGQMANTALEILFL